jgi:hypothetical protein
VALVAFGGNYPQILVKWAAPSQRLVLERDGHGILSYKNHADIDMQL